MDRDRVRIKPQHIALFGNFGSDNLGNEASLKAMLDFLRRERPELRITCVCYGVEKARKEHDVAAVAMTPPLPAHPWFQRVNRALLGFPFQFYAFMHALRVVRSVSLLIVPGTGIMDDFSERWQAMPFDLFKWGLAARLIGRSFVFVSIGAGPIHHSISRWLMVRAARMARFRSYRDKASLDYMQSLGVTGTDDRVAPDLVFALPAPYSAPRQLGAPRTIGVGVMHYYGWDRYASNRSELHEAYIAQITQFIVWLLQRGYRIRLLLGAYSDLKSFDEILRQITKAAGEEAAKAIVAAPAASLDDLLRQMMETDLVIATRFHNIVAALKLGIPAISIGYAAKNDVLLAEAGLGAFCQSVEQIDLERLFAQFERLVRERDQLLAGIRVMTEGSAERLADQERFLLDRFL